MDISATLIRKLDALIEEANQISAKAQPEIIGVHVEDRDPDIGMLIGYHTERRGTGEKVVSISQDSIRFATSSISFLNSYTGGESSLFYKEFKKLWGELKSKQTVYIAEFQGLIGILESAKREISEGFLLPVEVRVTAQVYGDLLEQAVQNLKKNEDQAAAIIAGAILDDGLKRIAKLKGVSQLTGNTIEPISHDLVKAGVIIELERKKISSWAEIHNKAEHDFEEFKKISRKDVGEMLKGIEEFLAKHLS